MKTRKTRTKKKNISLTKLTNFTTQSLSNVLSNYKKNKELKKIKAIKFEKLADKKKISKDKKDLQIWEERLNKENNKRPPAANLVLYPTITISGNNISIIIAGTNKNPGIPKLSIQPTVPSYLKILLIPLNKKIAEIIILPTRSKKFAMANLTLNFY